MARTRRTAFDRHKGVLRDVLSDTPLRRRQVNAFNRIDAIMATGQKSPSVRAADIVLAMLRKRG